MHGPSEQRKDTDMKITLSNTCVKRGSEMRLLGVTIDEKLNFGTHISEVCKTAARKSWCPNAPTEHVVNQG